MSVHTVFLYLDIINIGIGNAILDLFSALYFSIRSSRSSALRYGLPSCMSVKTLKIKIPVTVRRGVYKRSHEKKGDCEQSMPSTHGNANKCCCCC